jgi:hypothetical protein
MSAGDVRVFGLVSGTHVLEDIGMDVPHGREVVIPADKAARSKDLYRAISQKCVYQLPAQPGPQHVAPVTIIRDDVLQERNQFLELRCKQLEQENEQLRGSLRSALAQGERLDTILKAIQDVKFPEAVYINAPGAVETKVADEIADGTAPQFIPDGIAPKDVEARIDIKAQTSDSSVSSAADKLRRLRKGGS